MNETWKPVVGFEGFYEVSSMGRVKSIARRVRGRNGHLIGHSSKLLSPGEQQSGHLCVNLSMHGKPHMRRVHTLVALAFIGPCPEGLEVNHIDGDPKNNVVSNLEYVTHKENMLHAANVLNSFPRGEGHHNSKMTVATVREARAMRAKGMKFQDIADRLGVTRRTAARACNGELWAHVS
jgi:hypothetical protein